MEYNTIPTTLNGCSTLTREYTSKEEVTQKTYKRSNFRSNLITVAGCACLQKCKKTHYTDRKGKCPCEQICGLPIRKSIE